MIRPATLGALALGASLLAATALAQGQSENQPGHGSMMGHGMHDNMMPMMSARTRMMDSCARLMDRMAPPAEDHVGKPGTGQPQ
jgi:hypothetical protein